MGQEYVGAGRVEVVGGEGIHVHGILLMKEYVGDC